jgi:hypothetical protein
VAAAETAILLALSSSDNEIGLLRYSIVMVCWLILVREKRVKDGIMDEDNDYDWQIIRIPI